MHRIARAIGDPSAAAGLFKLGCQKGVPKGLRQLGMLERDLDRADEEAVRDPYWNPRPFGVAQREEIRKLLQDALDGKKPLESVASAGMPQRIR